MARPETITSLDNPRIKAVVRLREQSERKKTWRFIAEGRREIERALAAGLEVEELYFCTTLLGSAALPASVTDSARLFDTAEKVFLKIAYKERPEGMLGVFRQPVWRLDGLKLPADPLILAAVGLEKPGNLGAMARSAAAADAAALLVIDGVADALNPNAIRASTGAVFTLPILALTMAEAVAFFKAKKVRPIVAMPGATADHTAADLTGAVALVIGAEDKGLDDRWKSAGIAVRIPMPGRSVDSLNASVAAGILLFEALRQRGKNF